MQRRCAGMLGVMLSRERQPGAGTGRKKSQQRAEGKRRLNLLDRCDNRHDSSRQLLGRSSTTLRWYAEALE